jgi:hypothetical protein
MEVALEILGKAHTPHQVCLPHLLVMKNKGVWRRQKTDIKQAVCHFPKNAQFSWLCLQIFFGNRE